MIPRAVSAFLAFLLTLLGATPDAIRPGPRPMSQKQPDLQHEVSVVLKLVQVYVTDRDGRPVLDLAKDDFTLLDNGRPVAISEFEKHDLRPPAGPKEAPAEATVRLAPTPVESRTLNRRFIIFFDFAFNYQKGVTAAVQATLRFLDSEVLPGDEVALFSYSMLKGLKVHEYLTRDHAKVREAVTRITGKEIAGRADEVELRYSQLAEIAETAAQEKTPLPGGFSTELNRVQGQRRDSQHQLRNYLENMTALAKALRLVEGQKSILLFSTGVPYSMIYSGRATEPGRPGLGGGALSGAAGRGSQFEIPESTLSPLQEAMLKEFAAANCSFYAFDTREATKLSSLFAYDEMQFETGVGGAFGADGVRQSTTSPIRDDKTTGQDSLRRLSKQTGGQYFSNIGLYEQNLGQVQTMTGAYYVLGYSISSAWDGKFHGLKVSVERPGCQVRAQAGYFNPKPFRDYTDLEKELQLFDLALNERTELQAPRRLPMAALSYNAGEGDRLRTISRLPKESLAGFGGKTAEFVALTFDDKDNLASLQRATVKLADYAGKDLLFSSGLTPPPGRYKCRLVIRDLDTGQSAVASTAVTVAKRAASHLVVGSPLLLAGEGGLSYVEGVTKGKTDLLTWRDIYAFDETRYSPLVGDVGPASGKLGAVVPVMLTASDETGLVLTANLVNSETGAGLPVALELRGKARRANAVIHLVDLSLGGVPDGQYLFYIHAADKNTGAQAQTYVPLSVRRSS